MSRFTSPAYMLGAFVAGIVFVYSCGGGGGGGGGGPDGTLYDDFSSPTLDLNKWSIRATSDCTLFPSFTGEVLRTLQVFSVTDSACGLNFANPAPIRGFSADVTVREYTEDAGRIRARLARIPFNVSTSTPVPGEFTGDIFVSVEVKDFVPGTQVGFADWTIQVCDDSSCSVSILIATGQLGDVAINETRNLSIDWDGGTGFTFGLDGEPSVTFDISQVGWTNFGPPGVPNAQLRSRGTGSPMGSMDVHYDNVRCHTANGSPCPF